MADEYSKKTLTHSLLAKPRRNFISDFMEPLAAGVDGHNMLRLLHGDLHASKHHKLT